MKIGEKIKGLRRSHNLSQAAVAETIGMKREYFCKIETGALPNPTILTVRKIKNALGVSWKKLFDGVDE